MILRLDGTIPRSTPLSAWMSLAQPRTPIQPECFATAIDWIRFARECPSLAGVLIEATFPAESVADVERFQCWTRQFTQSPPWQEVATRVRQVSPSDDESDRLRSASLTLAIAHATGWVKAEAAFWSTLCRESPQPGDSNLHPPLDALQRCRWIALVLQAVARGESRIASARFDFLKHRYPNVNWSELLFEVQFAEEAEAIELTDAEARQLSLVAENLWLRQTFSQRAPAHSNIQPLERELEEAARAFAQDWQTKFCSAIAEIAAGAGHEINNPLGAIAGRARWLLEQEVDPERRQAIEAILRQVDRIGRMIRDLHFLGRPSIGERKPIALASVLTEAVATASGKRVAGRLTLEPCDPALGVHGVEPDLVRMVHEVVKNGVESAGPNGWVHVRAVARTADVSIEVTDSGLGFTDEQRTHAFVPFYSGRSAGRGLGMGLPVAAKIARDHAGDISIHFTRPTMVSIRLPIVHAA